MKNLSAPSPRPLSVFLVDDSALVREKLSALLALQPQIEISGEAEDVPQAIAAIAALRPDVVILDLSIPGGSGLDVLRAVKASAPATVAIIMTMHPYRELGARSLEAGADFYFEKGVEFERLSAVLAVLSRFGQPDTSASATAAEPGAAPADAPATALSTQPVNPQWSGEELFRRMMDSSRDCIKVLDLEGRLLWMNEGGMRTMEIDDFQTCQNMFWSEFWQGKSRGAALTAVAAARAHGTGAFTGSCPTAKGTLKWWDVVVTPMLDTAGQPENLLVITRDITAREQGRAIRLRLEHVFQNAGWGMVIAEGESQVLTTVNPAFATMHGYTVEEMTGMNQSDMFAPESREDVPALARTLREKGHNVHVAVHQRKDGSRFPCLTNATAFKDETGQVLFRAATFEDISERKRVELKLAASESHLRAVIANEPACVKLLAADGSLLEMNPAGLRMIEADSFEQVANHCLYPLVVEEHRQAFMELHENVFTGGSGTLEFELLGLQGGRRWFKTHASPLRDASGKVAAQLAIMHDITEQRRAADALRKSEERYRTIIEIGGVGIWETDENAAIMYFNRRIGEIFGYAPEDAIGRSIYDFIFEEDLLAARERNQRLRESVREPIEIRYRHKNGREIWGLVTSTPKFDASGRFLGSIGMLSDITERKLQETKIVRLSRVHAMMSGINSTIVRMRDREELLKGACRIAVQHGGFGMAWISELDPLTLDATPVAWSGVEAKAHLAEMKVSARADLPQGLGVSSRAMREKNPVFCNDMVAEPNVGGARRTEAIRHGYRSVIGLPLFLEGRVWGTLALYAGEVNFFNDDEVKLLGELADDISFALEHLGKEEKINYLAYYDALTGLANRALLVDRAKQQFQAAGHNEGNVALVMIDLERFRAINDTLGRKRADKLLRLVAERLRDAVFDRDSVARLHADIFAALLPAVADASHVARIVDEKIMACLRQPFVIDGQEVRVQAKAGVAVYPGDGTTPDALLGNAEAALRHAKGSAEHYLFYAPKMNTEMAEKLKLENKLRQAVEREEFVLHYQPKLNLREQRVAGLEALLRWNDPERGLVPPGLFIPLLEETGLIVEVGAWAMRQAVAQHAAWRAAGMSPPRIAVNLSQVQLKKSDFLATVQQAIARSGEAGHGLDLEITESMIMEDIEDSIAKLKAVRALGVEIALDDFGTGYSSLQYIARLPISALKIDRSFVTGMTTDANDMTMVSTIISMAHNLGLKVIAEGVETEEQSKFLSLLKCDEVQGHLFSKPLPAAQIEALLREKQALAAS